ncbi:MAG: hypothetical protein L3J83_06305, partial [Proteobacteria bacterium]|nr:hypothetical protein [Pseudomonadota bacterium]
MSKNIIIILLLISFNLAANDNITANTSTVTKEWAASKAAAIQQQAQLDELNLNTKKLSSQEIENKRNKLFQEQTGEGVLAHPEETKENIQQEVIQKQISDIRANAQRIAAKSKEPLYEIVNKLHNNLKIISKSSSYKSLQVSTIKGSQVNGGGEVYIYTAKANTYLGYTKINSNSKVVLPVIDKQLLDLVIIPAAPLPLQIIKGVAPFSLDEILLEDGVKVLINLEHQGRKLTSTTADLYLQLQTKYGIFDQLAGTITGSWSVLLANATNYRLEV